MLDAIDAALKRIEDGTYGICTNCGKPIPEERLEAVPWATHVHRLQAEGGARLERVAPRTSTSASAPAPTR